IWHGYFKFSIERNPWDREVSAYFWMYRDEVLPLRPGGVRPSFDDYMLKSGRRMEGNFDIYTIDGKVAVDFMCRYETLTADLAAALVRVGIYDSFHLPSAKADTRTDRRDWREFYTARTCDVIAQRHALEITAFGYKF